MGSKRSLIEPSSLLSKRAKRDRMNVLICDEVRQSASNGCEASEADKRQERRGSQRTRPWRHPSSPHIKLPYRVAAAVAVMEMGISDYSVIAHAVGLSVEEVERIDMVEDPAVRQLALAGIPVGESFKLSRRIRCPKCQAKIALAPCIACHPHGRNRSAASDMES
ncbi:MAG TPA: hypothetical protein DD670_16680 [Planctomycetaceae bacterium]|nr:hypothetical protein [Planctomycetaceae bacterium]